jgi:hypothetical protein
VTAAEVLRASVAALPNWSRREWRTVNAEVRTGGEYGGWHVATSNLTGGFAEPVAEHIARVASPDVVLAVADLLDALRVWGAAPEGDVEATDALLAAYADVEAILRDVPAGGA